MFIYSNQLALKNRKIFFHGRCYDKKFGLKENTLEQDDTEIAAFFALRSRLICNTLTLSGKK